MVKHGKDKKRRAGRYGRVKLKNKNYQRWNPKPKFGDKRVKELWDVNKTPKQNLQQMGFCSDGNAAGHSLLEGKSPETEKKNAAIIELFHVPESDSVKRPAMTDEDQEYVAQCMRKHGDNYTRMFRDIKTNDLQWTEQKLQKMCSRFLLLTNEQRNVDVPDKVKHLVGQ